MGWKSLLNRFKREPDFVLTRPDGVEYLRRWYIFRTRWFNCYLHRFSASDWDRHPHDHPWRWLTIILKGSYLEEIYTLTDSSHKVKGRYIQVPVLLARKRRAPGTMNYAGLHRIHRVTVFTAPIWTLFLTGPKEREWGFYTPSGWKPYTKYKSSYRDRKGRQN